MGNVHRCCCLDGWDSATAAAVLADVNAEPVVKKLEAAALAAGNGNGTSVQSKNEAKRLESFERFPPKQRQDPPKVTMIFQLPDDTTKEVEFRERPLGLRYSMSAPPTILEVNPTGRASALGVQVGWKVKSVCNEDLINKEATDVNELLCQRCSVLPVL